MSLYALDHEQVLSFIAFWPLEVSKFFLSADVLYFVVWRLYLCSQKPLWTGNCDTFPPALQRLLLVSLTVAFGYIFTALTLFLWSTAVIFFGQPVQCLAVSILVVFLFQDIPNGCIGYTQCLCNCTGKNECRFYRWTTARTQNNTFRAHIGNKKHLSVIFQFLLLT